VGNVVLAAGGFYEIALASGRKASQYLMSWKEREEMFHGGWFYSYYLYY
jgi:hypothetical protein